MKYSVENQIGTNFYYQLITDGLLPFFRPSFLPAKFKSQRNDVRVQTVGAMEKGITYICLVKRPTSAGIPRRKKTQINTRFIRFK